MLIVAALTIDSESLSKRLGASLKLKVGSDARIDEENTAAEAVVLDSVGVELAANDNGASKRLVKIAEAQTSRQRHNMRFPFPNPCGSGTQPDLHRHGFHILTVPSDRATHGPTCRVRHSLKAMVSV